MANYSLQEAFKELRNPKKNLKEEIAPNTLNAAKKAGYTEVKRGSWYTLEDSVPAKYFNIELPRPAYGEYDVQRRNNSAINPTTGQKINVPEYRVVWANDNRYGGRDYASKAIKAEQVNLSQFRSDRSRAKEEAETAEYTKQLNEFNVNAYLNMDEVNKALDEIANHIDIEPSVREDILKRAEEAIGGPKDWCTVVVLTDQYADNNPREHSKISRTGMSKEDAYYDALYSNRPIYQQLNSWCAWHYDYMKTKDADEFLAKQIQRENDIHSGKIKVEHH